MRLRDKCGQLLDVGDFVVQAYRKKGDKEACLRFQQIMGFKEYKDGTLGIKMCACMKDDETGDLKMLRLPFTMNAPYKLLKIDREQLPEDVYRALFNYTMGKI